MALRPAVFLDRDGTIIEAVHYLGDPALVRLLPGAAEAIRTLRQAGYACVVVTNQSAIGRGVITVDDFHAVQAELGRQLEAEGAALDATYFCPTVPSTENRTAVDDLDRKPGPGMLHRAAADHGLDLSASWMVGDMVSDVLAGHNAGCRGALFVRCGQGRPDDDPESSRAAHVADTLLDAARWILAQEAAGASVGQEAHAQRATESNAT